MLEDNMACARPALFLCFTLLVPLSLKSQARDGAIAGKVSDAGTKPLPSATVRVLATRFSTHTRDDGAFSIEHLPAGTYRLAVDLIGFLPDTASVTVTAGEVSRV